MFGGNFDLLDKAVKVSCYASMKQTGGKLKKGFIHE
jgi:hypothetical protein